MLTSLISSAKRKFRFLQFHSAALLIILVSSWLTLFNITEILYSQKIQSVPQHLGMLFFLFLSLILQSFLILVGDWYERFQRYPYSDKEKEDYGFETNEKLFLIGVLAFFEITFFIVYWIN